MLLFIGKTCLHFNLEVGKPEIFEGMLKFLRELPI